MDDVGYFACSVSVSVSVQLGCQLDQMSIPDVPCPDTSIVRIPVWWISELDLEIDIGGLKARHSDADYYCSFLVEETCLLLPNTYLSDDL